MGWFLAIIYLLPKFFRYVWVQSYRLPRGKRGRLCSFFYVHSIFLSAAVCRFRFSGAVAYDYGYSVPRFKYGFGAEDSVFFFFIGFKKCLVFGDAEGQGQLFIFSPDIEYAGKRDQKSGMAACEGRAVGLLSEVETGFFWKGRKRTALMERKGVLWEKGWDILRIVIITAAVYRGFNSRLRLRWPLLFIQQDELVRGTAKGKSKENFFVRLCSRKRLKCSPRSNRHPIISQNSTSFLKARIPDIQSPL